MTITFRSNDLAARRRASLDRIRGEDVASSDREPRSRAREVLAMPRSNEARRLTKTRKVAVPERLAPPPTLYYAIAVIVAFFIMLGLVMVLSATSTAGVGIDDSPYAAFQRQLGWAVFGAFLMAVAMKISYPTWRRVVPWGAALASALMLLPFVPGIGATINDARSWVRIGPIGFQPSEFLKLATVALLAHYLATHLDRLHDPRYGILPVTVVMGLGAGAAFAQGDMGSAGVLAASALGVAVIAGVPLIHLTIVSALGLAGSAIVIMGDARRLARFTAFLDLEGNKEHIGYQGWQSVLSIANGGLTGSGIGGSRSKLGYLPLAHSDFIFAVVADELGLIGAFAVIGGFAMLSWYGIQAALAAPDSFGMLLAGGISTWFGIQAFINMGGVVGLLPVTGITLPFFSAGGTSLITSMVAAGLLLNVARRAQTSERPARRSLRQRLAR